MVLEVWRLCQSSDLVVGKQKHNDNKLVTWHTLIPLPVLLNCDFFGGESYCTVCFFLIKNKYCAHQFVLIVRLKWMKVFRLAHVLCCLDAGYRRWGIKKASSFLVTRCRKRIKNYTLRVHTNGVHL